MPLLHSAPCRLLAGRARMKVPFSPADEKLAVALFERQVPIEIIEHPILMACTQVHDLAHHAE
jgi:hypothetical protein